MQRENAPETSAGLTTCVDGGAGYISNPDRFHSDTAGEEQQRRMEQLAKKQRAIEFRRNQVRVALSSFTTVYTRYRLLIEKKSDGNDWMKIKRKKRSA